MRLQPPRDGALSGQERMKRIRVVKRRKGRAECEVQPGQRLREMDKGLLGSTGRRTGWTPAVGRTGPWDWAEESRDLRPGV